MSLTVWMQLKLDVSNYLTCVQESLKNRLHDIPHEQIINFQVIVIMNLGQKKLFGPLISYQELNGAQGHQKI